MACRGGPEPLREAWVFGSGENGCAVRMRLKCAECGCFPGRDSEVRGKWVLPPGEIVCAWKTVVPRTKEFSSYYWILLCIIGLSANSQEMLSTL